jgi:hypothetical protein
MTQNLRYKTKVHFRAGRKGRKHMAAGEEAPAIAPGRVPLISRLMALAIRFDSLIRRGDVTDQAELARLGHVSRARLTQIMNLLLLAPDIQEAILHLPLVERGSDPLLEKHLRPIAAAPDWRKQRRAWNSVTSCDQ